MKKKTACVVVGAAGRMGRVISRLIAESENFTLAGATESSNSNYSGKSLKDALGLADDSILITEKLEEITADFDAIIDFTFPEVSMQTVRFAGRQNKPAVIGTTGFSAEQMTEIKQQSEGFPCVWAPNMSIGVNTLFKVVQDVAMVLKDGFDVEIMEIHHRYKKDAPSGTALKIAQIIAQTYGRDLSQSAVYQRKGVTGERKKEEIGIQTLRAGDVAGEHTVVFGGTAERLELIHRAQSRDCFAQGALCAVQWIVGKPRGLYDMQDVLGLKG